MNTNPDGTIDVQVVLTVQVDPHAWARYMMGENPDEVLQKEVRHDVKKQVRNRIQDWPNGLAEYGGYDADGEELEDPVNVPIGDVTARGVYA
jgi:hypothetical protein